MRDLRSPDVPQPDPVLATCIQIALREAHARGAIPATVRVTSAEIVDGQVRVSYRATLPPTMDTVHILGWVEI